MKRQLSIQYEDIVNFINDKKKRLRLAQIITYFRIPLKEYGDILYKLYADKSDTDEMLDYAIPIITDIYNDNYELAEPKYYWKLKINSNCGDHLYAFRYIIPQNIIGVKKFNGSVDSSTLDKFNKSKLTELLNNTDTTLTISDFTPVEEIEK